jgi:hypothetical protein
MSMEARAAAQWRHPAEHQRPPGYLSAEAKRIWREIVLSRPADFFRPGSLHLLEQFCVGMVAQRANLRTLESSPLDRVAIAKMSKLALVLNATAARLRLTVQSDVDRSSRRLDEQEPKATKSSLLAGKPLRIVGEKGGGEGLVTGSWSAPEPSAPFACAAAVERMGESG